MKIKHNKLRNPLLLFELLVRQITTDTLNNKESKAVDILKKHYNNSILAKEYNIYKTLLESKNISETRANVLLDIALQAHSKLNKNSLRKQKYELVSDIKKHYNIEEFFKSKIDNYKTLASIYMLFEIKENDIIDTEKEAQYRFTILESISNIKKEETVNKEIEYISNLDRGSKNLIYKLAVQKFNEKYSTLDKNQKHLLKEYISNISTSDKLRDYVNSEFANVKKQIVEKIEHLNDDIRKIKISEVVNYLEEVPDNKQVCEKDIYNLLYSYELLKEIKSINEKK